MLRVLFMAAGIALLPRIASSLPPTGLPPVPVAAGGAILLVQAAPEATVINPTIAWAQARLAEIDAAVATLEAATRAFTSDPRRRADTVLARLRVGQGSFRSRIAALQADGRKATDAQLAEARSTLEGTWSDFERELDTYLTGADAGVGLRTAVLTAREKAEEAYWQQAIAALKAAEAAIAAERRPPVDAAIAALQSYSDGLKARLAKLQQAGVDAWSAFQDGLAEARRAFDKAYEGVLAAIERARQ